MIFPQTEAETPKSALLFKDEVSNNNGWKHKGLNCIFQENRSNSDARVKFGMDTLKGPLFWKKKKDKNSRWRPFLKMPLQINVHHLSSNGNLSIKFATDTL